MFLNLAICISQHSINLRTCNNSYLFQDCIQSLELYSLWARWWIRKNNWKSVFTTGYYFWTRVFRMIEISPLNRGRYCQVPGYRIRKVNAHSQRPQFRGEILTILKTLAGTKSVLKKSWRTASVQVFINGVHNILVLEGHWISVLFRPASGSMFGAISSILSFGWSILSTGLGFMLSGLGSALCFLVSNLMWAIWKISSLLLSGAFGRSVAI